MGRNWRTPCYQFLVHGRDAQAANRGFFTTRHAFADSKQEAAEAVLRRLTAEFTAGVSAEIWASSPPILEVESAERIGWFRALAAPNKGSTFYRD